MAEHQEIAGEYQLEPSNDFALEIIIDKKMSFEEASRGLSMLGKDESGIRYAYLMITAMDKLYTDVSAILNFKHVLFLDLSGNCLNLKALQDITAMPYLVLLKADRNRVESAALNPMPFIQVLTLNKNRITETCDINQPMLDSLELQNNLIFLAQFDAERLKNLKELDLRANHFLDVSGSYPPSILRLYLPANRITKICQSDLSKLVNLEILHLRDNSIHKLNGFSSDLVNLKYLNLRNNKITKLRQFRKLKCLPNLEVLIITGNPVDGQKTKEIGREDDEEIEVEVYGEEEEMKFDPVRIGLLVLLPNLKRINKDLVKFEERDKAIEIGDQKFNEIMDELSSEDETEAATTTEFTTYTSEATERKATEDDLDYEDDEDIDLEEEETN